MSQELHDAEFDQLMEYLSNGDEANARSQLLVAANYGRMGQRFFNLLLTRCAQQGHSVGAAWCAMQMPNHGLVMLNSSWGNIFKACSRSGDVATSERTWRAMMDHGFVPSNFFYKMMFCACEKSKDVIGMEHWVDAMLASGIILQADTFLTIIKHACELRVLTDACYWIDRMVEDGFALPDQVVHEVLQIPANLPVELRRKLALELILRTASLGCKGCKNNTWPGDVHHTRNPDECRYPDMVIDVVWCPACIGRSPREVLSHSYIPGECQLTSIAQQPLSELLASYGNRRSGSISLSEILRVFPGPV